MSSVAATERRPAARAELDESGPSPRYTVDIDIGGTLTDGLFTDGKQLWTVKVDTTPHDFTVCFFDCLREGAQRIGFDDLTTFLEHVALIRWSATIASNVLAEHKGPRLGLLVSAGHERDLYGEDESPALGEVIDPQNVSEVSDPGDLGRVLEAVRALLERGVRRICVSLEGSFEDDGDELAIKDLVEQQFPDHYLGSVPLVPGSELCPHPDANTRTHVALVNAYVHTPLAATLFKAEDELMSEHGYHRPLYIGHVNGGVARVAKTKGVDTIESGPVFGQVAAAHLARLYELDRVITLDVGGTTAKVGVIVDGEPLASPDTDFFGIPAKIPWFLLRSVALGGGSVARVDDGEVKLGPDSMGAYPGPASYDLGGSNATLTDAFLTTGRLNPDRFLGGRKKLNPERAKTALEEHVASPLSDSLEEAADAVIETAVEMVDETVRRTLVEGGHTPEGFDLFCFGGNGGNFAAAVAEKLGLRRAYVFQLGPVLSAFGSSVSDISHVHEEWPYLSIEEGSEERLQELVEAGKQRVLTDLEGEGLSPSEASLELELTFVTEEEEHMHSWSGAAESQAVREALSSAPEGSVVQRVAVRGVSPVPHFELTYLETQEYQAEAANSRPTPHGELAIYDWDSLEPGAVISGPGMLESDMNSCMVPAGWRLTIDGYGNAVLEKE